MDKAFLETLVAEAAERRAVLARDKGKEYTRGSVDRLANFKRVAEELGLAPLDAWWVYFRKHQDALLSYVLFGKESSNESIETRIDDMQVYLDLARGLIWEAKNTPGVNRRQTLNDLQAEIGAWQEATFPEMERRAMPIVQHLRSEAQELEVELAAAGRENAPAVQAEAADVFILLVGLATSLGFNLEAAVKEKMAINKKRKWGPPQENGVIHHVPAAGTPVHAKPWRP